MSTVKICYNCCKNETFLKYPICKMCLDEKYNNHINLYDVFDSHIILFNDNDLSIALDAHEDLCRADVVDIDKVDELGKYYYQLNKSLRVYKYGNRRKRKYENDEAE